MQKLQKSMVGGERANDRELKERRLRKKKAAERRLQALAKVLSKVEDEDGVFLQVYDDIQQELSLKTDALRKSKLKVKGNIYWAARSSAFFSKLFKVFYWSQYVVALILIF